MIHEASLDKTVYVFCAKLFVLVPKMRKGDFISANGQFDRDITAMAPTDRLDQIRSHLERMREMSSLDPE